MLFIAAYEICVAINNGDIFSAENLIFFGLVVANGIVYLFHKTIGIVLTGILLLLATLNLIHLFPNVIMGSQFSMLGLVSSPPIDIRVLGILVGYLIINGRRLTGIFRQKSIQA